VPVRSRFAARLHGEYLSPPPAQPVPIFVAVAVPNDACAGYLTTADSVPPAAVENTPGGNRGGGRKTPVTVSNDAAVGGGYPSGSPRAGNVRNSA